MEITCVVKRVDGMLELKLRCDRLEATILHGQGQTLLTTWITGAQSGKSCKMQSLEDAFDHCLDIALI